MRIFKIVFILCLVATTQKLEAQILFPSHYQSDYYDVLQMKNNIDAPITNQPSLLQMYAVDSALNWDIWDGKFDLNRQNGNYVRPIDPFAKINYSSGYPDSYNDGAVWEGKGLNSSINFGFSGRVGILHFTFAPVVYYAQNKDFYIAPTTFTKSEYSYPFERKIDWVLRYGDQSVTKFHPGQSEVRVIYKKATFGFSTQSMVWGPAQVSPLLMSNNAGGIPHFDLGTAGPVKTKLGNIEYKMFWGLMNESDYFDDDSSNDQRYITGATLGFQPKFIPGLNLGFNRVMYREMFDGDFRPLNLFAALWKNIEDDPNLPNDEFDQMFSLMVEWKFKEYGFDAYLEWARNDFPGTLTDLLENPERTRALTLGMVKTFDLKNSNLLRIVFEHTMLNKIKMSVATTGHPTYYVHGVVDNGYTNDGQIMGAYIGPGSNAHHVKIQYYTPKGRVGLNFDRVRFNDDYFIANFASFNSNASWPNDFRYRLGVDFLRFIGSLSVDANLTYGYHRNWYYEDDRNQRNINLGLRIGYLINK